jgi:hypothetical protein
VQGADKIIDTEPAQKIGTIACLRYAAVWAVAWG